MDERTCDTCKHAPQYWDTEPCYSCTFENESKWEPKEDE